jgi:hypothetical protein
MAYNIRFYHGEPTDLQPDLFRATLMRVLEYSRFRIEGRSPHPPVAFATKKLRNPHVDAVGRIAWTTTVMLRGIILKSSKEYCGQHAFACEIANPGRALLGVKERKGKWLEGADWVAFNDMVNDILDLMNNPTADVWSDARNRDKGIVIRQGRDRCIEYFGDIDAGGDWKKFGVYEDCVGMSDVHARYPEGTPGIATYWMSDDHPPLSSLLPS